MFSNVCVGVNVFETGIFAIEKNKCINEMLWRDSERGEFSKKKNARYDQTFLKINIAEERLFQMDGRTNERTDKSTNQQMIVSLLAFSLRIIWKQRKLQIHYCPEVNDDVAVTSNCFDLAINQRLPLFNWCCCF